MSVTSTPQPVVIRPQRRIGEFAGMCTLEESGLDELEIAKHPIQDGAQVSDNAYLKSATLSIKAQFNDNEAPLQEVYERLRTLQAKREVFDVVTGKRLYKNMLMKSIAQTTDATSENTLSVSFAFEEIIIVQVEVASLPARAKQKQPAKTGATQNAGAKSAKPLENKPQKQKSILSSVRG
jgi:hypothetical protein